MKRKKRKMGNDQIASLLLDISDRKTPNSVRKASYDALREIGIDHRTAQKMADAKSGDYWS